MQLLNHILEKAYGRVESNLCALSDRGWNPPNRRLLDHPDLVGQDQYNGEEQKSVKQVDYWTINTETRFAGTCIDKMISHQMRNGGIEAHQKRLEESADIGNNLMEAGKGTTGVLVSNGIHSLNDPALVAHIRDKKRVEEEAGKEKANMDRNCLQDLISKVAQTRTKRGRGEDDAFAKWTTTELSTYLQYKKLPEYGAMPTWVADKRNRCRSIMERKSQNVSPHASDYEGENALDDEGDASDDEGEG